MSRRGEECGWCEYGREVVDDNGSGQIRCLRYPPRPHPETENGVWPIVGYYDWCGEFMGSQKLAAADLLEAEAKDEGRRA